MAPAPLGNPAPEALLEAGAAIDAPEAADASAEASLVERARTDPQAFAELYRLHYRAVGRCLHRRTGDVHAT